MKRTLVRRCALATVAMGTALGSMGLPTPAGAAVPAGNIAIGIGGSDTSDKIMGQLVGPTSAQFGGGAVTGTLPVGTSIDHDRDPGTPNVQVHSYNIPALGAPKVVDGDADCSDVTWVQDPPAGTPVKGEAPFGSSAGRDYLREESDGVGPVGTPATVVGGDDGCVDVARSSSGPRTLVPGSSSELSTFRYYAFALDSVSWATTSNKAPGTMTKAHLKEIYACTKTDWGQLPGGTPGPIQRYIAQAGSGTRAFFISDMLDGANPATGVAGCPDAISVEESNGSTVIADHLDKAIMPYSTAVWDFQETNRLNPSIDIRKDARLGGITTAIGADGVQTAAATPNIWVGSSNQYKLDTAGVVTENNVKLVTNPPSYPGIRYIFNVIDTAANRPGYQAAAQLFGFVNLAGAGNDGTKLCAAAAPGGSARAFARSVILSNGFAPLATTGGKPGTNNAGSTCREYIPA